tara:strand:- start:325 stop:546 length:222 start_codon:yes stop_codon:yes gene_type:complete
MKDEKHTVLAVTKEQLEIIFDCLQATEEELINDLNYEHLTNSSAIILSRRHDVVFQLKRQIQADLERRLENEA